jgi:hypothetical protein
MAGEWTVEQMKSFWNECRRSGEKSVKSAKGEKSAKEETDNKVINLFITAYTTIG